MKRRQQSMAKGLSLSLHVLIRKVGAAVRAGLGHELDSLASTDTRREVRATHGPAVPGKAHGSTLGLPHKLRMVLRNSHTSEGETEAHVSITCRDSRAKYMTRLGLQPGLTLLRSHCSQPSPVPLSPASPVSNSRQWCFFPSCGPDGGCLLCPEGALLLPRSPWLAFFFSPCPSWKD